MGEEPSSEDTILADTNLFVGIGDPDNSKYQSLREFVTQRDLVLLVPRRVRNELSTMHVANRVDTAVEEEWATVVDPPSPTQGDAVNAMDFVRREIARQTGKDEHEVEKADTVFAGLAIEYLQRRGNDVVVLTDDRVAAAAITRAIENQGYGNAITILTRAEILDGDDDVRII
jgi:hypothetical protein